MMGAYTAVSATDFNLLKKAKIVLLDEGAAEPMPLHSRRREPHQGATAALSASPSSNYYRRTSVYPISTLPAISKPTQ
jgi:hypothetical protein